MKQQTIVHPFEPVYDATSTVLLLGTMASPKSREQGFYYGHPQNKFWRILADVYKDKLPFTIDEKKSFLYNRHIALWDVLYSCDIHGAADSSIQNPIPNNFLKLLQEAPIQKVFTTGTKATALYKKLCEPLTQLPTSYLPSTSPANSANYTYEELVSAYQILLKDTPF